MIEVRSTHRDIGKDLRETNTTPAELVGREIQRESPLLSHS